MQNNKTAKKLKEVIKIDISSVNYGLKARPKLLFLFDIFENLRAF